MDNSATSSTALDSFDFFDPETFSVVGDRAQPRDIRKRAFTPLIVRGNNEEHGSRNKIRRVVRYVQ